MIATVGFELDRSSGGNRDAARRRTHFHHAIVHRGQVELDALGLGGGPANEDIGLGAVVHDGEVRSRSLRARRCGAGPWLHDHDRTGMKGVISGRGRNQRELRRGMGRSRGDVGPADLLRFASLDGCEIDRTGFRWKLDQKAELVALRRLQVALPRDRRHPSARPFGVQGPARFFWEFKHRHAFGDLDPQSGRRRRAATTLDLEEGREVHASLKAGLGQRNLGDRLRRRQGQGGCHS